MEHPGTIHTLHNRFRRQSPLHLIFSRIGPCVIYFRILVSEGPCKEDEGVNGCPQYVKMVLIVPEISKMVNRLHRELVETTDTKNGLTNEIALARMVLCRECNECVEDAD